MNRLYFGDNLEVLRSGAIEPESVDFIYLDPPFNSNATYNVIFKSPKGQRSSAQVTAFKDSWQWLEQAEVEFSALLHCHNASLVELIQSLRRFLGESNVMAYLTMMSGRLVELHRVLKPTGSLYLHCDPTASHYLKVVLDAIFGADKFRSEISWKRSSAHNDGKQGRRAYGNVRDVLLFYTKSDEWTWNSIYTAYDESYTQKNYRHVEPGTGRRYRLGDLTAAKDGGDVSYEFRGTRPYNGRFWAYSRDNMEKYYREGRLYFPKNGGTPSYIRYLDEMPGVPLQNDWDDIGTATGNESLGYQTQKPIALLERAIRASSNEGDVVLDAFCGCGTAIHAAQRLKRRWIGIDVTHLAITIVERRLRKAYPSIKFAVHGAPVDLDGARDLFDRDPYEFQYWACALVKAQPFQNKKKGADGGIDGLIFFQDEQTAAKKIVVSVKGGQSVSVQMIRDLRGVVEREKAAIGLFVTLAEPTAPMCAEAIKAGFYVSPVGKQVPRMQIVTIAGLLDGSEAPRYTDISAGEQTFKPIRPDHERREQTDLFDDERVLSNTAAAAILERRRPKRAGKPNLSPSEMRIAAAASKRPKVKRGS